MRITFSRFPSLFLRRDSIRHHHLVFIRRTVTQPTAHPPPRQKSMRRLRIHPSLQSKVRNKNPDQTLSNRFVLISDRNYLGDSPQNISPKITPQESPPNIYSAGIHQVCGDAETHSRFLFIKDLSSCTGECWRNYLLLLARAATDDVQRGALAADAVSDHAPLGPCVHSAHARQQHQTKILPLLVVLHARRAEKQLVAEKRDFQQH